ncbi:glycerophosphodiester phosphodiesterase [Georgenia sunbinii]|uniref:glycerophosphodiester phosphodiesterase n=1 Tax=Georgenia sunbinii TaxID=3117728 RepID=UPI002F265357
MAHRGGGLEVPENSRTALEHTVALGYQYLETDLHRTVDDVVVLLHDDTLDRTTDGRGPLGALRWDQAALLRDRSGGRLVRLDEALRDFPSLLLNIDLKEDAVVGPTMRVLAEHEALDRVVFSSFSDARLRSVRRLTGGRARTSMGPDEIRRLVVAAALPARLGAATARAIGVPHPGRTDGQRAHCVQVPVEHRGVPVVTPGFVAVAHALGLDVHVWTIDDRAEMTRLLDLGVDGLVTDRPTLLRDVLRERGQWPAGPAGTAG